MKITIEVNDPKAAAHIERALVDLAYSFHEQALYEEERLNDAENAKVSQKRKDRLKAFRMRWIAEAKALEKYIYLAALSLREQLKEGERE